MSSIEASLERQIKKWRERHPRLGFAVWATVTIEVALWLIENAVRPVIDTASEITFLFDNWHLVRTVALPTFSRFPKA